MTETYQTDISLYGRVMHALHVNHGRLPDDFILNENNCTEGVVFSEGTLDKLFSCYRENADEKPYERILEKADEDPKEACQESNEFFAKEPVRYVMVQDNLKAWRQEHHPLIQNDHTVSFLKQRIRETVEAEELKFLLDTCGELNNYDEELQKMIRNLSESSEMAAFCYPSLKKFPDGNELIFQIAKNVDGQAKAEAIYALNPDDEEKKRWMIYEGKPGALGWYSTGAVIARKCDFALLLEDPDLSMEDRDRIGEITCSFMEEGPAVGLRELPDWEGLCRTYIHMVRENPSISGIHNICHEYDCLEFQKYQNVPAVDHLLAECEEALHDKRILAFGREKIRHGENLELSELLNIPYDEDAVFDDLKNHFHAKFRNVRYLKEPDHIRKAFEILFETVDFSVRENTEDFSQTENMVCCFTGYLKPEFLTENSDESFVSECNEMILFGLRNRQCKDLYKRTVDVADTLQKEGVIFNETVTAVMEEINRKQKECRERNPFMNQLLQAIQNAREKQYEEEKMRS